ncbi:MAG: hypothetical protein RSC45_12620 [Acinetobacter sp.]
MKNTIELEKVLEDLTKLRDQFKTQSGIPKSDQFNTGWGAAYEGATEKVDKLIKKLSTTKGD